MKSNNVNFENSEAKNIKHSDQANKEAVERLKIAMQMNIKKYGMPDSSKMERKLRFVDVSKYFGKDF